MSPAILELTDFRERMWRVSVDAYVALAETGIVPKRAELIRGVIVENMPKSPLHVMLTRQLYLLLVALQRAGFVVLSEAPLRLADSMPEPDVMIVRGAVADLKVVRPSRAELVVEVAVSSVALDRENAGLYAEATVPEYWIVLALEQSVEVYRQPKDGVYQQKLRYGLGETLTCESVPGVELSLTELFA